MPLNRALSITAMNVPAIEFHKSFRLERFAKDGAIVQAKSIKSENVKKIIVMQKFVDDVRCFWQKIVKLRVDYSSSRFHS